MLEYVHKLIEILMPYQERWREWAYETRQPVLYKGAKSHRIWILKDEVTIKLPFPFGRGFLVCN